MIFQWIKNYISDIKIAWMLVRYKRCNTYTIDYEQSLIQRAQSHQEMWMEPSQFHQAINNYNTQVGGHGGNGYIGYTGGIGGSVGSSGDEWSNGPDNGYKIIKRVDAGGKAIGIFTRWELFYFMMKNKDDQSYDNFIYLSTDGLSKHDWHVEVIGVDMV